jgi:phosphatidate cytidylyltransferase
LFRTRFLSSVVGLALLFAIVLSGQIGLLIAVIIIALIGIAEFYKSVANIGYRPIRVIGYLSCISLLFISSYEKTFAGLFKPISYFSLSIFLLIMALFFLMVLMPKKYNVNDISLTVFGIIYVVFLISFIISVRNLEYGKYYIWLIFIGAWATDTFAYLSGVLFGKTKILPEISPKKSLEGSIGGVIGCIAVTLIYGLSVNKYMGNIPIYHFIIIAFLSGIISQVGDWTASAIKRYVKVKDFGNIMPGHGGVLDRIDSILFTAPLVYFYLNFVVLNLKV